MGATHRVGMIDAYANWFHLFSGARVAAAATPSDLIQTVERELLG